LIEGEVLLPVAFEAAASNAAIDPAPTEKDAALILIAATLSVRGTLIVKLPEGGAK